MADNNSVNVQVGQDLIKPIVEAKISAALTAALVDQRSLIEDVVAAALNRRVGSDGKDVNSSWDRGVPYIEWLVKHAINASATAAVKRWVEEHTPELQKELERQLTKSKSAMVRAFVEGLGTCIKSDYRISADVKFSSKE